MGYGPLPIEALGGAHRSWGQDRLTRREAAASEAPFPVWSCCGCVQSLCISCPPIWSDSFGGILPWSRCTSPGVGGPKLLSEAGRQASGKLIHSAASAPQTAPPVRVLCQSEVTTLVIGESCQRVLCGAMEPVHSRTIL
jgi:hypothetical protein